MTEMTLIRQPHKDNDVFSHNFTVIVRKGEPMFYDTEGKMHSVQNAFAYLKRTQGDFCLKMTIRLYCSLRDRYSESKITHIIFYH